MENQIYMNLNTYQEIALRLDPSMENDPDYCLYKYEDETHVMQYNFQLPSCSQKYWKRNTAYPPTMPPIIEMTQAEKDAVDLAEAEAIELSIRESAKSNLDEFVPEPLTLRGVLNELLKWLNKLNKSHKGQIGIESGNTAQSIPAGQWAQITQFNTAEGYNGISSGGITVDKANNKITIDKKGDFIINVDFSIVGTNGSNFKVAVYTNGNRENGLQDVCYINANGDSCKVTLSGIIRVDSDNFELTLWAKNTEATNRNFKIKQCQFMVFRQDSINDSALTDLITSIKASIENKEVD